ncbi:MAG: hypothetical protein JXN65_01920 [Clostridia bacterium]|nr:hypothetical protein [Clostridia bacterium]
MEQKISVDSRTGLLRAKPLIIWVVGGLGTEPFLQEENYYSAYYPEDENLSVNFFEIASSPTRRA